NISLDTLQADKYRRITRGGSLEGALAGIEAARAAGLYPIKINAVLIRGFNDDELMDLARLSLEEDVHVRFIELMPIGEGCRFWPEGYLSAEDAIAMMPGLESLDASDGVAQSWRLPGAGGTVGFIKPVSHHFCGSCNRLRLTADGMLKPCLHSDSEIPVRGLQGEALKAAFEAAIMAKPAENREMSALMPSRAGRPMNRIGG
ncbi:MAG: radical SAM protein, partial [Clostridia bacterium]|nr:radical SAM protein [Clostridia bacterium]